VILDWCFHDTTLALGAYQGFVARYPDLVPFADKARARMKTLRVDHAKP
jgi:hypothetical protein